MELRSIGPRSVDKWDGMQLAEDKGNKAKARDFMTLGFPTTAQSSFNCLTRPEWTCGGNLGSTRQTIWTLPFGLLTLVALHFSQHHTWELNS